MELSARSGGDNTELRLYNTSELLVGGNMKNIPNSEYKVDKEGNVYNPKGVKIVASKHKRGYMYIKVNIGGTIKTTKVHRLVAMTYIPNPDNLPQVNHIDGDKGNNNVENLEWAENLYNSRHAVDVLGIGIGSTHSQVKYPEELIRQICEMLQDGYRNCDIVSELGVNKDLVARIRNGKNWPHVVSEYNIPRNKSHTVSDETFKWICHKLQEGWFIKDIIDKCTHKGLNKLFIYQIKNHKVRPEITKLFNF